MFLTKLVFWASIIEVVYAYLGYPFCLWVISLLKGETKEKVEKGCEGYEPLVSLIITAFNEERKIKDKIENSLAQDYDRKRLEIIVTSDCSTDRTDDIVREYKDAGIILVRIPERKGKESAQMEAIRVCRGDILVFSDAGTMLERDAIRKIAGNFWDKGVGCVSSRDKFIEPDGRLSGEGAYVRYEMFLRELETKVGTLVGLSGSFFAARREVCNNWAADLQSDFNTLLNSIKIGMKGILDPNSVGYYKNIADSTKEFDRKVRTVVRGITVFKKNLNLLNFRKYGIFSWQLFSHKLCRWLVPISLILLFISNLFLARSSWFYTTILMGQIFFYGVGSLGILLNRNNSNWLRIPIFFVDVNVSILTAWVRYLRGERISLWQPSRR